MADGLAIWLMLPKPEQGRGALTPPGINKVEAISMNDMVNKIKYLMAKRGWNNEDLARELSIIRGKKVTPVHAGKLVRSENKQSKTAADLAAALGVTLEELYRPGISDKHE